MTPEFKYTICSSTTLVRCGSAGAIYLDTRSGAKF